jgi:AcrR family transcriptional regulator
MFGAFMVSSGKTGSGARETILNAAEELFAQSGFDGVPVREVAKHANVTLSLVTYHFATKDQLFDHVLGRRSHEVNAMRASLLDEFIADGSRDLRRLVEAYTMPFLLKIGSGDPQWRSYGELISQLSNSAKYAYLIKKYYDGIARRYANSLAELYEGGSIELAIRSLVFSISVLMGAMSSMRRVDSLSDGQFASEAFSETYPHMVKFICRGIEGIMASSDRNAR